MTWKQDIALLLLGGAGGFYLGARRSRKATARPKPRDPVTVAQLELLDEPLDESLTYVLHRGELVGEFYDLGDGLISVVFRPADGSEPVKRKLGREAAVVFIVEQMNQEQ